MKKKLAAARRRIENGDGAKGGEEEVEVKRSASRLFSHISISLYSAIQN